MCDPSNNIIIYNYIGTFTLWLSFMFKIEYFMKMYVLHASYHAGDSYHSCH